MTTTTDGGTSYALYRCASADGGTWASIGCTVTGASSVAYVPSNPGMLFVCSDLEWSPVPLPQGPQGPAGPQGDAGPQGTQGNSVTVTPEPAGSNCPAGGQKIQVVDANGNPIGNPSYVCNGGQCRPGQPNFCDGQVVNACSSSGVWITWDCASQGQTCIYGGCQGNCAQGASPYCNGQWAYTSCNPSGYWNYTNCAAQSQTCINGSCQGNCAQGASPYCNGETAYEGCSSNGQWSTLDCAGINETCVNGACQGVCTAGATQSCNSGVQGCDGIQYCGSDGTWGSFCHAINCQPFPLDVSPNYDCSSACVGASCDDYYLYTCPTGTTPYNQCDANCVSGCCVGATSGTGCDWGTDDSALSSSTGQCHIHMGTSGCNGMTMNVRPWCVGQPN